MPRWFVPEKQILASLLLNRGSSCVIIYSAFYVASEISPVSGMRLVYYLCQQCRRRSFFFQLLNTTSMLYLLDGDQNNPRFGRQFWMIPRPRFWFEEVWQNAALNMYWHRHFRMRKETFKEIVQLVGPQMQRQDTQLRSAIPIQKHVAIAVWRLATGDSYRAIGTVFGVGKSTAIEITLEFCRVLEGLAPNFIVFPQTRDETMIAIASFKESVNCRVPQAVGAIDGTHIEIIAPSEVNKFDYFDRNKRYSIILQGIVGANLKFLDIEVGYPGAMDDCRILKTLKYLQEQKSRKFCPNRQEMCAV